MKFQARSTPGIPSCKTMRMTQVALVLAMSVAPLLVSGCAVAIHDQAPPGKVLVCHKGKRTLSIGEAALKAHLGHGDYRGRCR